MVDQGIFDGLSRGGDPIIKTFDGDLEKLLKTVEVPPLKKEEVLTH